MQNYFLLPSDAVNVIPTRKNQAEKDARALASVTLTMLMVWIFLFTLQHATEGANEKGQILIDCRSPEPNTYYKIVSVNNKKSKTVVHDHVVMFPYVGWNNQLWQFTAVGQGFYKIKSKETGRVLSMDEDQTVIMSSDSNQTENHWYLLNAHNSSCNIFSRRFKKIISSSGKAANSSRHLWDIYKMKIAPPDPTECIVPSNDAIKSKLIHAGQVYLLRNAYSSNLLEVDLTEQHIFVKQWRLIQDSFECGLYKLHADFDNKYILTAGKDGTSVHLEVDNPDTRSLNRLWSVVMGEETFFAIVSRSTMKVLANKQLPGGSFIFYLSTWKTNRLRQKWSFIAPGCKVDAYHYYAVVAVRTGKVLTLENKQLTQQSFDWSGEQLWQTISIGQFQLFKVKGNGRLFAHDDDEHLLFAVNADQVDDRSQWAWYSEVDGTCVIYAKGSKDAIGVVDNGTNISLNSSNYSANQKWHFIQLEKIGIGSTCYSSPEDAMTLKLLNTFDPFIIMSKFSLKNLEHWENSLVQQPYKTNNIDSQLWTIRPAHGSCGFYKILQKNGVLTVTNDAGELHVEADDSTDTNKRQLWRISRWIRSYFFIVSSFSNNALQANGPQTGDPALLSPVDETRKSQLWHLYIPGCAVNSSFFYSVTAFHSGLVLTIEGESVVQHEFKGLKSQMWRFVRIGNGYYNLRSYSGDRVLGVTKDNWLMVTSDATGSDRHWYLDKNVAGTCSLYSRKYRMYADVPLSSKTEGRKVTVFFPGTSANQRWTFTKITRTTPFADECVVPPEDAFLKKMINPNDTYVIMDYISEKVFHISYDVTKDVLPVVLWEYKSCNNTNLMWYIRPLGCGLYKIVSLLNHKVLAADTKTASVRVEPNDDTNKSLQQLWSVRHERETYLSITSRATMLNLEVENAKDGAPITQSVWKFGGGSQLWSLFIPGCQVDPDAYYAIVALHSGQVLTVQNNVVVQWPYLGWANQMWQFASIGEGFYNIRSKIRGVIAGVQDAMYVMAVPETLSLEKQWYIYNSTEGTCSIYSRKYRKVLDVRTGSTGKGARVVIYSAGNERHQRWTFIKIDKAPKLPKTCYKPPIDALTTKLINSGDSYTIMDKNTEMDMEVPFSATDNFTPLKQWEKREANTTVQKWRIRPVPVECGLYKIVSDHNNQVLSADPEYNSIYLDEDDNQNKSLNQLWSISLEEETYFNIVSRGTMKALETGGSKNGSLIVQSDWKHKNKAQEWSFMGMECKVNDQSYYAIVAKSTGKVLTRSSDEVVQWSYKGDDSQLWKFVRQKTGYQIAGKQTTQFITLDKEGNTVRMNDSSLTPWKINSGKLGFCNIMTEENNQVIGTDAETPNEKQINVYNKNFASNQQWNIVKIEGSMTTN